MHCNVLITLIDAASHPLRLPMDIHSLISLRQLILQLQKRATFIPYLNPWQIKGLLGLKVWQKVKNGLIRHDEG
jgi:hypothetical protein